MAVENKQNNKYHLKRLSYYCWECIYSMCQLKDKPFWIIQQLRKD